MGELTRDDTQAVEDLSELIEAVELAVVEQSDAEANGADIATEAGPSNVVDDLQDDWTCAICLDVVPIANLAVVKGCGHTYCANCIVHWASTRTSEPRCPTCKAPFCKVMTHKNLDGSFSGEPIEESVVLLARSPWFQDWLAAREQMKQMMKNNPSVSAAAPAQPVQRSEQALMQEEWAEEALYGYFESQYEDDDVEDMYMSNGPRRAIGNRPYGPNGFIAAGRKLAAPKRQKSSKGKGDAGPSKAGAGNSSNNDSDKKVTGRRARRAAKRAAADAGSSV